LFGAGQFKREIYATVQVENKRQHFQLSGAVNAAKARGSGLEAVGTLSSVLNDSAKK
jgi:hypothetical protein